VNYNESDVYQENGMRTRSRRTLKSVATLMGLAAMAGMPQAHAEIYTWVDASGAVNVTNLPPPKTARVTNVIAETPPRVITPAEAAAAAARQEAQALAARVQELEWQVEQARAVPPPPPIVYAPPPAPPMVVQYFVEAAPQPVPVNSGCDAGWNGCGFAAGSFVYPPTLVIYGAPRIRPVDTLHRERNHGVQPGRDGRPGRG
jgi:hypothetical protein